jgi:hypothetical protein
MSVLTILSIPVILLGIIFLPSLLDLFVYPIHVMRIRARCRELGVAKVEIKAWPDHYGVSFHKDGQKLYAKCRVGRRIEWMGRSPDQF